MVKGIITGDSLLALGIEEDYKNYDALSNKKEILKIAKQLQKIGDCYEVEHEVLKEDTVSHLKLPKQLHLEHALSVLKEVFKAIDVIFDWFESSGNLDACEETQDKKEEGVLRGLFHLLGFGHFASFVYEIASKFLDIPENYCKAKREHIVKCLKAVEDQKPQVLQLVTEAGEILKSIIKEHVFNLELALQFDNIVRQVKDVIESCKDYLATAEKTIQELTESMTIIKWCSRGIRVICFVVACHVIYNSTCYVCNSTAYAAAGFGFAFLSMFARRAYIFNDSLASLKCQHRMITKGLQHLERKLDTARNILDRAKESKLNTQGH